MNGEVRFGLSSKDPNASRICWSSARCILVNDGSVLHVFDACTSAASLEIACPSHPGDVVDPSAIGPAFFCAQLPTAPFFTHVAVVPLRSRVGGSLVCATVSTGVVCMYLLRTSPVLSVHPISLASSTSSTSSPSVLFRLGPASANFFIKTVPLPNSAVAADVSRKPKRSRSTAGAAGAPSPLALNIPRTERGVLALRVELLYAARMVRGSIAEVDNQKDAEALQRLMKVVSDFSEGAAKAAAGNASAVKGQKELRNHVRVAFNYAHKTGRVRERAEGMRSEGGAWSDRQVFERTGVKDSEIDALVQALEAEERGSSGSSVGHGGEGVKVEVGEGETAGTAGAATSSSAPAVEGPAVPAAAPAAGSIVRQSSDAGAGGPQVRPASRRGGRGCGRGVAAVGSATAVAAEDAADAGGGDGAVNDAGCAPSSTEDPHYSFSVGYAPTVTCLAFQRSAGDGGSVLSSTDGGVSAVRDSETQQRPCGDDPVFHLAAGFCDGSVCVSSFEDDVVEDVGKRASALQSAAVEVEDADAVLGDEQAGVVVASLAPAIDLVRSVWVLSCSAPSWAQQMPSSRGRSVLPQAAPWGEAAVVAMVGLGNVAMCQGSGVRRSGSGGGCVWAVGCSDGSVWLMRLSSTRWEVQRGEGSMPVDGASGETSAVDVRFVCVLSSSFGGVVALSYACGVLGVARAGDLLFVPVVGDSGPIAEVLRAGPGSHPSGGAWRSISPSDVDLCLEDVDLPSVTGHEDSADGGAASQLRSPSTRGLCGVRCRTFATSISMECRDAQCMCRGDVRLNSSSDADGVAGSQSVVAYAVVAGRLTTVVLSRPLHDRSLAIESATIAGAGLADVGAAAAAAPLSVSRTTLQSLAGRAHAASASLKNAAQLVGVMGQEVDESDGELGVGGLRESVDGAGEGIPSWSPLVPPFAYVRTSWLADVVATPVGLFTLVVQGDAKVGVVTIVPTTASCLTTAAGGAAAVAAVASGDALVCVEGGVIDYRCAPPSQPSIVDIAAAGGVPPPILLPPSTLPPSQPALVAFTREVLWGVSSAQKLVSLGRQSTSWLLAREIDTDDAVAPRSAVEALADSKAQRRDRALWPGSLSRSARLRSSATPDWSYAWRRRPCRGVPHLLRRLQVPQPMTASVGPRSPGLLQHTPSAGAAIQASEVSAILASVRGGSAVVQAAAIAHAWAAAATAPHSRRTAAGSVCVDRGALCAALWLQNACNPRRQTASLTAFAMRYWSPDALQPAGCQNQTHRRRHSASSRAAMKEEGSGSEGSGSEVDGGHDSPPAGPQPVSLLDTAPVMHARASQARVQDGPPSAALAALKILGLCATAGLVCSQMQTSCVARDETSRSSLSSAQRTYCAATAQFYSTAAGAVGGSVLGELLASPPADGVSDTAALTVAVMRSLLPTSISDAVLGAGGSLGSRANVSAESTSLAAMVVCRSLSCGSDECPVAYERAAAVGDAGEKFTPMVMPLPTQAGSVARTVPVPLTLRVAPEEAPYVLLPPSMQTAHCGAATDCELCGSPVSLLWPRACGVCGCANA